MRRYKKWFYCEVTLKLRSKMVALIVGCFCGGFYPQLRLLRIRHDSASYLLKSWRICNTLKI